MYEIVRNVRFIQAKTERKQSTVIATIINTEGSSYRKKWTQMVVAEDMTYEGALSGGCVEREVLRQSNKLFYNKGRFEFEYDGTENLGCKGKIWVCLEYLSVERARSICEIIEQAHKRRETFHHGIAKNESSYTFFRVGDEVYPFNASFNPDEIVEERKVPPQTRLVIIGGEFDSFILARTAQWSGFDTHLLVYKDFVKPSYSPDYKIRKVSSTDVIRYTKWDDRTALILMTHSMARDFTYLEKLIHLPVGFIGALGPKNRREELIEKCKDSVPMSPEAISRLNALRGPVGLHIHARTPEEIAVSIISELIEFFNLRLIDQARS